MRMRKRAELRHWAAMGVVLAAMSTLNAGHAGAATTGYWRAETDTDAGIGLSIPDEVAGNPLTASNASIDTNVPVNPIPLTGAANTGSINGNANINGTIAQYAALNTNSATVEFYARTTEGAGDLVSRTDGATSGFKITNFNAVSVSYYVDNGLGGSQLATISSGVNLDTPWDHLAWTYDSATGVGRLFSNGNQVGVSNITTPGMGLVWTNAGDVKVGTDMDGGGAFSGNNQGIFDELRFSDQALDVHQMLNSTGSTLGYWAMNGDTNHSANGLSTPNLVAGGSAMTSGSASIAPQVPQFLIPGSGAVNTGSLNGIANINASAANYGKLSSGSATVEFFARTTEGDATLMSRTNGTSAGFSIDHPGSLQLHYYVDDGSGGSQLETINVGQGLSADWKHVAWTYDKTTGLSQVYLNGQVVASNAGSQTPGRALIWDGAGNLQVGTNYDGGSAFSGNDQGTFDELRITGEALTPSKFLNAALQIDFQPGGGDTQSNFQSFTDGTSGDTNVAKSTLPASQTYTSVLGKNGTVTVALDTEGDHTLDFRDRGNSSNTVAGDIIEDHVKNQGGGLYLTLEDLAKGQYEMMTWHHEGASADPGGGAAGNVFDIRVSDSRGSDRLLLSDLVVSGGINSTDPTTALFRFYSNGVDPVTIFFDPTSSDQEMPLNGFSLVMVPAPAALPAGIGLLALLVGGGRRRRHCRMV